MTTFPFLITVDHGNRTIRRIVHEPPAPPRGREQRIAELDAQLHTMIEELAVELKRQPDDVAAMLATILVLDEADEAAYRRVAEQRGVLAL